jgi:hypothetical protein
MLTDTSARRIASDWHAGGGSPSYQFVSTGRIVPELSIELTSCRSFAEARPAIYSETHLNGLGDLLLYVEAKGPRDEMPGWGALNW